MDRPRQGMLVIATAQHMTSPAGTLVGTVEKLDGSICWFREPGGDLNQIIWKFSDGPNTWHEFARQPGKETQK